MQTLRNSFPGQEQDEAVFIFARPFVIAFIPTILLFLAAFGFGILGQIVLANNLVFTLDPLTNNVLILLLGVFELAALIVFLVAIFDFYFDLFIVTNRRLVDVRQEELFSRPISELTLDDVQDTKSEVTGLFETAFNYGTVKVQTAGTENYFTAENLRYPREITAIINDLAQQAKADIEQGNRQPHTPILALINNTPLNSISQLKAVGAVLPEEADRLSGMSNTNAPR